MHNTELKRRTLASIIEQAGYTPEDFRRIASDPPVDAAATMTRLRPVANQRRHLDGDAGALPEASGAIAQGLLSAPAL